MAYQLSSISSVTDCDALTEHLNDVNASLENRRSNLVFRTDKLSDGAVDFQQEMAALNSELSFEQNLFGSLAEGDRKEESRLTILDLQLKIGRLKKTEDTYGAFGTVLRQHSLVNVLAQMAETDQLLSEVATFRTTLA